MFKIVNYILIKNPRRWITLMDDENILTPTYCASGWNVRVVQGKCEVVQRVHNKNPLEWFATVFLMTIVKFLRIPVQVVKNKILLCKKWFQSKLRLSKYFHIGSVRTWGTTPSQTFFEIQTFLLKKLHLKLPSAFSRQKSVGLDELKKLNFFTRWFHWPL